MDSKDIATGAAAAAGFIGGSFVAGPVAGAAAATAAAAGTRALMGNDSKPQTDAPEQSDGER